MNKTSDMGTAGVGVVSGIAAIQAPQVEGGPGHCSLNGLKRHYPSSIAQWLPRSVLLPGFHWWWRTVGPVILLDCSLQTTC